MYAVTCTDFYTWAPWPFNTLLLNIKSSKYAQIQEVTCSLFKSELDAS